MNLLQKTQLPGTRFGTIEYGSDDLLKFEDGLIGFPAEHEFVLVSTSDTNLFQWLQSVSTPSLAFLVTDPRQFVSDYEPFGLEPTDMILATVTIPHGSPQEMTLNLVGPIIIDQPSRNGCQIVLDGEAYTTKHRVFAKASSETEQAAA